MLKTRDRARFSGWLVMAIVVFAGCTDDSGVYERPPDDLTGAEGFLGYSNVEAKRTLCGNCHVGQQTRWNGSAHSGAWESLRASGHAQAFCEGCHTTGAFGNATEGSVGFAAAPEERYHDVQCEACHGPGQNHVLNPDVESNQPVPSIAVASEDGCGECHTGAHHPFVEEWELSLHAEATESVLEEAATSASYQSCLSCHSGQGALKAWGVTSNYLEKNAPVAEHLGIVCAVCHDPHGSAPSGQLRFPIDVPDAQQNLCMLCHNRRGQPDVAASTLRGPHAPEGPLLLGGAGWWPPGFDTSDITHPHGTEANPRLCASCHVDSYAIEDASSGEFLVQATGHSFAAIPCVDEEGIPDPAGECEDAEREFRSCAAAGCHRDEEDALSLYRAWTFRAAELVGDVEALLEKVPEGELDLRDGRFTVADGAWFNAQLGALSGSAIHNPNLTVQLLEASIEALESEYGLSAPRRASLE